MKKVLLAALAILVAIGLSAPALAQTNLFVDTSVAAAHDFGYSYVADLTAGVRRVNRAKTFEADIYGFAGLAPKWDIGNGHHYGGGVDIYWTPFRRHLFLGGGAAYNKQITSLWSKSHIMTHLTVGVGNEDIRLFGTLSLPPKKLDVDPWVYRPGYGASLKLRPFPVKASGFYLEPFVGYGSFHREDSTEQLHALSYGYGIRYNF